MGFLDSFGSAMGSAMGNMAKTSSDAHAYKEQYRGKSAEELKRIFSSSSSSRAEKMAAAALLREMGYGN